MSGTTHGTTDWKDQSSVPAALTVLGQWAPVRAFRAVYGSEADPADLPAPVTGDVGLVAPVGAGAWAGHGNDLAEWDGDSWNFTSPVEGLVVGVPAAYGQPLYIWTGSAWQPLSTYLQPPGDRKSTRLNSSHT